MDDLERQRRRDEIAEEVREGQRALGHPGAMPAFLNLITEFIIDTEYRLDRIEATLGGHDELVEPPARLNITNVNKGNNNG